MLSSFPLTACRGLASSLVHRTSRLPLPGRVCQLPWTVDVPNIADGLDLTRQASKLPESVPLRSNTTRDPSQRSTETGKDFVPFRVCVGPDTFHACQQLCDKAAQQEDRTNHTQTERQSEGCLLCLAAAQHTHTHTHTHSSIGERTNYGNRARRREVVL